jgi:hypothetical protein
MKKSGCSGKNTVRLAAENRYFAQQLQEPVAMVSGYLEKAWKNQDPFLFLF